MSVIGVRPAGERAVVLDCDGEPSGLAAGIREMAERLGVRLADVVPGAATVLVVAADPTQLAALRAALPKLRSEPAATQAGPAIEIPIRYDGPDLAEVAAATGLSVAEVVRRHSSASYLAAFTGFAPGFAYLTGLDPALRLPRRSSPRPRVPAGSVAIADAYTAVYPRSSPGGWHLLGTTESILFDASREPPALIAPGTRVRFVLKPLS